MTSIIHLPVYKNQSNMYYL